MIFETERLCVRKMNMADIDDMYEYLSDAENVRFMTFPVYKSKAELGKWMQDTISKHGDEPAPAVITLKDGGKVIGTLNFKERANRRREIGYILNPKFHGKAYMTEAVTGVIEYIKSKNLADEIYARVDPKNKASERVLQKVGMKLKGRWDGETNPQNDGSTPELILYEV